MITTAWLIVDWWWWLVSKQTVTAVITILTFVPLQQQQQLCDHRHPHYSTVSRSGLQSSPTFTSHPWRETRSGGTTVVYQRRAAPLRTHSKFNYDTQQQQQQYLRIDHTAVNFRSYWSSSNLVTLFNLSPPPSLRIQNRNILNIIRIREFSKTCLLSHVI